MSEAKLQERTREEIEELKRDWEHDPCWDLETTEGFEAHREELLAHRLKVEARWEKERAEQQAAAERQREQQARDLASRLSLGDNLDLARYLLVQQERSDALETRVAELEQRVRDLSAHTNLPQE